METGKRMIIAISWAGRKNFSSSPVYFDKLEDAPILIINEPLLTSNLGKLPIVLIIPSSMTYLRNRDHFSPML